MITKEYSWIEISKKAFQHNIDFYRKLIGNRILAIVIKANAYGHGLKEIGYLCQQNPNVNWLCTATLSEAIMLRTYNVKKPILVLSLIDEDPLLAIQHDIDLLADNYETIQQLHAVALSGKKKIAIHVKIDTGMSRFGFLPHEAVSAFTAIKKLPYIFIRGIYSHFSESANNDQAFTQRQTQQFEQVLYNLNKKDISIPYQHFANSAAIKPDVLACTNFIRLGAGAYGLIPFQDPDMVEQRYCTKQHLKPILTWKTKIVRIKKIPAGSFIGYDCSYQTTKDTIIAMLPIGYYDGYDKRLTNQGIIFIKINNEYAPVIGRICMNITMIDISTIKNVSVGDEVIIIGPYQPITAHTIAKKIGCYNPREVTTRLNPTIIRKIVP